MARRQQTLSALSIHIRHPKRNLGILVPANQHERPPIRRFKRFIEAEFANLSQTITQREQNALWRS